MKITNLIFDGSQAQNIQNNYNEDSGLFQIDPIIDDPLYPIPKMELINFTIQNFMNLGLINQKGRGFFILNYYFGNVLLSNVKFDTTYFPMEMIAFLATGSSELIIENIIIQNHQNNPFLHASGTNLILNITNITAKDFTPTVFPFYLFVFWNINQTMFINFLTLFNINGQALFFLDTCSLKIQNWIIANSSFGISTIYLLNHNTYLSISDVVISSCILNDSSSYFLVNQGGILFLSRYFFDNITNFQFLLIESNSFISNGIFFNIVTEITLILDTSTFSLFNI